MHGCMQIKYSTTPGVPRSQEVERYNAQVCLCVAHGPDMPTCGTALATMNGGGCCVKNTTITVVPCIYSCTASVPGAEAKELSAVCGTTCRVYCSTYMQYTLGNLLSHGCFG